MALQLLKRLTLLLLLAAPALQAQAQQATFAGTVAQIVYQHCTPCHRRGGIAPFPLESY